MLHTLVDGIALSASVVAELQHGAWLGLGGLDVFAVALQAIGCLCHYLRHATSALVKQCQWIVNVVFSLACPLGALGFYFGIGGSVDNSVLLGWGLAASAGFFVGIALADLLPEVAFHDHDRGKLTGISFRNTIAVGVENLPGHSHDHSVVNGDHSHHEDVSSHPAGESGHGAHDHS